MKKLFIAGGIFVLASCNSDSTGEITEDSTATTTTQAIENVNGNIPDTSNSIKIPDKTPTDIDSTHIKDSLKK